MATCVAVVPDSLHTIKALALTSMAVLTADEAIDSDVERVP